MFGSRPKFLLTRNFSETRIFEFDVEKTNTWGPHRSMDPNGHFGVFV